MWGPQRPRWTLDSQSVNHNIVCGALRGLDIVNLWGPHQNVGPSVRAGATDSGLGGGGAACSEKGPLAEGALF